MSLITEVWHPTFAVNHGCTSAPGGNMHYHRMQTEAKKLCQSFELKALQILKGRSHQYNFCVKSLKAKDPTTLCQEGGGSETAPTHDPSVHSV